MHPMTRNTVIGVVSLLIAGGLVVLALLGRNPDLSIIGLAAAGIIAALVGIFLYVQGWVWGTRAARWRQMGQALAISIGAGIMGIIGAVALAGLVILLLLFVVG